VRIILISVPSGNKTVNKAQRKAKNSDSETTEQSETIYNSFSYARTTAKIDN
jgi:hypothetical protein